MLKLKYENWNIEDCLYFYEMNFISECDADNQNILLKKEEQ